MLADTLAQEAREAAKENREWSATENGSDGVPMGRRERHKKISLDSGSVESGEEGSRAVCRKAYSGKSDKEVEGTSLGEGLPSAPGKAGEPTSVDAINRRRTQRFN